MHIGDEIRVGTSGWTYDDFDGAFYPPGVRGAERLAYYAEHFDTVEVNATFYRFPTRTMIDAWNRVLGVDFSMVLKGHRRITHHKRLEDSDEVGRTLRDFLEVAVQIENLDCILWQLPPTLEVDHDRLEAFLSRLRERSAGVGSHELVHAVEFRHPSWWNDRTRQLLSDHDVAFVAVSHPEMPEALHATAQHLYVRFHGLGEELYRYDYSDAELEPWARRIKHTSAARRGWVFFNNDYDANAISNARRLRQMLGARAHHDE